MRILRHLPLLAGLLPVVASFSALPSPQARPCSDTARPRLAPRRLASSSPESSGKASPTRMKIVEEEEEEEDYVPQFGVSYIGGDPCGSKYNDDPFDASAEKAGDKPGMPDTMKLRIEAMAEKMKQREAEQSAGE